jgi:hypothetical protein
LSGQLSVTSRTALRLLAAAAILAFLLAALPGAASAHEGVARLILEPERVNPGGVVTIRGEDLRADDPMTITLIASDGRTELTTVTSDGEGHFTVTVQLSPEAAPGVYAIEAAGQVLLTVPLFVEGAPVSNGDGAPPGQDEGLPAVIPSFAATASQGPIAVVQPGAVVSDSSVDVVPFVAAFGAIAALAFLAWRTRRPSVPRGPDLA